MILAIRVSIHCQRMGTDACLLLVDMKSSKGFRLRSHELQSPLHSCCCEENLPFCTALHCRDLYPMLLVANKVDLVHLRKVTEESGRELAHKLGIPYIETSAKDPPLNVDAAFHEV